MEFLLVKKITYKGPIKEAPVDFEYWKTRSHEERIAAVEFLRQCLYEKVTPRLKRVYRNFKRK